MNMTKEAVMLAVFGGATSLSEVYRSLGGKGNVSGSTTKKMREMIPNISDMMSSNKIDYRGNETDKNSKAAIALKSICPDVYEEYFPSTPEAVLAKEVKDKSKALKGKERIVVTYQKTGNPFKAGTMKYIFFHFASKSFQTMEEITALVSNDEAFINLCREANGGVDMPFEQRAKRVGWQRDMTKASHQNSHGATDIIKDESGKIKAVCLI